jgi:beta-galactosidase
LAVEGRIHALDTTRPTTLCPSVHWLREYLDGTPYLTTDEDEWMRDDPERQKADWMHYASIFRSAVNNLPDNEKGQVYPETYIRMDEDATKNLYPYLDIAGYNYYEDRYEVLHKLHPERVLLGTETRHTMLPDTMKFAKTHPYLIGDFVWTLQSHLGEINCCDLHYEENEEHKSYPWVTNHGGVLDLTGQAEPSLHRYEFIWGGFLDKPVHALYLASQPPVHNGKPPIATSYRWTDTVDGWTYEGYEGKRTFVDAYTDADSVEIFVNGKSAGKAQVKDYFAKIPCIYEPGELVGVGYDADGHEIYRTSVRTADAETVLTVKTDKNILRAGGQDFCFVDVYVTDKNGTVKLLPDYDVKIEVVGAASLQGYGSAAYKNAEHYDQHHHKSWQGHLQAVLRSTEKTGPVTVTFTADGCAPAILHLSAE